MPKASFHLHTDNQELIDYLRAKKNISKYLADLVVKHRAGALVESIDSESKKALDATYKQLQIKNLEATIENKGYKNRIDKVKADYAETFGKPVSPQANKAIETRFESAKPQTATEISKATTLRFMRSCKKNELDQWVIICDVCSADHIDTNQEKALEEFRTHLQTQHKQELLT